MEAEGKQVLFILYGDGSIEMPKATSVGEARAIYQAVMRHAESLESQVNGLPLHRQQPEAPPAPSP